VTSKEETLKP